MDDAALEAALGELVRLGDPLTPIAIRAANSLRLMDSFEGDSSTAEELARLLGVQEEPLRRMLNFLASVGVLAQTASGAFTLTAVGDLMRCDHPMSMRDAFTLAVPEIRAWIELEYCVRTGRSGFERSYGETHRNYRSRHLEEDVRMDQAHKAATRVELVTLIRAYPWAEVGNIVDVGGGTGAFLAGILERFAGVYGTLFDLPRMIANAEAVMKEHVASRRCRLVGGDFFEQIPRGGDIYVLKAVVGGWDDASCVRIFTSIRRAMSSGSRLLVIEPVLGVGQEFSRGNVVQLQTLVLYGGKDRSMDDYRRLAEAAGFEVLRVIPRSTLPIIELVPKIS